MTKPKIRRAVLPGNCLAVKTSCSYGKNSSNAGGVRLANEEETAVLFCWVVFSCAWWPCYVQLDAIIVAYERKCP